MPIKELHFPGAAAISEKTLIENSRPLLNETYDATEVTTFVDNTLLPLYGERGYLKARFEQPSARLLTPDHGLPSQDVALTASVDEGVPYEWDSATWTANHAVSSDTLNKLLDMRAQAPANMTRFAQGMRSVRDAYMKRGYVEVKISSQQEFDDAARRVNYRFSIDEGPQFHMGTLEIEGLPDKVTARLVKKWKLQPGDVFDETYLNGFMKEAFAEIFAEHLRPNNSRVNTHPDSETKTVNVEIDFR